MTEEERLIAKHRANGLLIDSNLLVLLLVGRTNPARIANCNRTSSYDVVAYELLERFVAVFDRKLTTPQFSPKSAIWCLFPAPSLRVPAYG